MTTPKDVGGLLEQILLGSEDPVAAARLGGIEARLAKLEATPPPGASDTALRDRVATIENGLKAIGTAIAELRTRMETAALDDAASDRRDMEEWVKNGGGEGVASNQILYNLTRRGPEWEVIPWCRQRNISIMAYSPIEQGRMLGEKALAEVAARHDGATAAQVALGWLLRRDGMIVIPKSSRKEHVRENFGALDLKLTDQDVADLDKAFPPPKGRTALGML